MKKINFLSLVGMVFVVNNFGAPISPEPVVVYNLTDKISEAVTLLKASPPLKLEYKTVTLKNGKKKLSTELARKQIALVLLNTNTGQMFEKRVWAKEDEVKNYKKTGVLVLQPDLKGEPLNIQPRLLWNSFNTDFQIDGHPELLVIANKYPFDSKYIAGLPEQAKTKYTDIFYSPYSGGLHQSELIEMGKRYISENVDLAYYELNRDKVINNPVDKEFIKAIILTEHTDPDLFAVSADNGKKLTERVLAIIGANQNRAYRYTGSPAGASGLAQFISSTYKTIVRKYPAAKLIKNYNQGMADHKNAIKAMVLFFDAYKGELLAKIKQPASDVVAAELSHCFQSISDSGTADNIGLVNLNIGQCRHWDAEEMLAASYNGGPNRVISATNRFGLAWMSQQFELPKSQRNFKTETLSYIKKFLAIRELDMF